MKRTTASIIVLAGLVGVLLLTNGFTLVSSASAQLGNTGVPVKCYGYVFPDTTPSLSCTAADGTAFVSGVNVPSGHYLMVTDILVAPLGPATGSWFVALYQVSGTSSVDMLPLSTNALVSFAEHFTTPYLILSQGQHLTVNNSVGSSGAVQVLVSGLLTTNATYLPLTMK